MSGDYHHVSTPEARAHHIRVGIEVQDPVSVGSAENVAPLL